MNTTDRKRGRVQLALSQFNDLPDEAIIRAPVVAALRGCSEPTIWRHARSGLIPKPVSVGPGITGWRVGDIRESLKRAA